MLSCSSCSLHSASYPPREPAQELRPGSDPGGRFVLQGPRIRSKLAQCIGQLRRTNCLPPQQLVSPASLQKGIRQLIHITAFPQSEITRRLPHRIIQNPHELYRNALNRAERNYVPIHWYINPEFQSALATASRLTHRKCGAKRFFHLRNSG
jgi:hypothetical protein